MQVLAIPENSDPFSKWMGICVTFLKQRWVLDWGKGIGLGKGYSWVSVCSKMWTDPNIQYRTFDFPEPMVALGAGHGRKHSFTWPWEYPCLLLPFFSTLLSLGCGYSSEPGFANECSILGLAEDKMKGAWYPVLRIHHACLGLSLLLLQRKINFCLVQATRFWS